MYSDSYSKIIKPESDKLLAMVLPLDHTISSLKNSCLILILGLLCILAGAQSAAAQDEEEVLRVESNLVQLNVGVADPRGRAITNLSQSEFVVYEDGVRQAIQSFEPGSSAFSLVLLLDVSGSTLSFRTTLKQTAARFIDALAPDDRIAVIAFNDKPEMLADFTSDRKKIGDAIFIAEGKGGTELYQALRFSLEQLAREGKRRKAIVVLTDGIDSSMRNQDRSASANARNDKDAVTSIKPETSGILNAVLDMADRQGVTIYPLALPTGDPKRIPDPSPQQVAVYTSARARIQALANRTGGRLHEIRRLEDMGRLYAEVAADLRTLYSIAYQPSGERKRDGQWRAIRIEVTRPNMIARTRPGYYAR